jgi:hypothetical protein
MAAYKRRLRQRGDAERVGAHWGQVGHGVDARAVF